MKMLNKKIRTDKQENDVGVFMSSFESAPYQTQRLIIVNSGEDFLL